MAIRLIETKEPVMIIGGHKKKWRDIDLFWAIDECTDPNLCEYLEIDIPSYSFCIEWPKSLGKYDDCDDGCNQFNIQENISFGVDMHIILDNIFSIEHGWTDLKSLNYEDE